MRYLLETDKQLSEHSVCSPSTRRVAGTMLLFIAMLVLGLLIPVYPAACLPFLALAGLCFVLYHFENGLILLVVFLGIFTDGYNPNRGIDDIIYRLNVDKLYIMEMLVYTLGFICITRSLLHREYTAWRIKGTLDRVLPLLAAVTIWFMYYGYERTNSLAKGFGYHGGRVILVGIVFYFLLVNTLSGTEAAIRLFKWLFVAAAFKATYALIAYLIGRSGSANVYDGIPVPLYEIEESFALAVCVIGAVSAVIFGILKKWEILFALAGSTVMILVIVLSLRRSVWLSLVVAFIAIFFLGPVAHKIRLAVCAVLFAGALLAMGADVSQRLQKRIGFLAEVIQRPSLIARQQGSDLQFHYYDILDSWAAFKKAPFGRGFPGEYRRLLTSNQNNDIERYLGTGIVHNEVLNIAVKMGVIGVGVYFLMLGAFFWNARQALRLADVRDRALLTACIGTVLGGAALGLTSAHLMGNTKYPMLYFMMFAFVMVVRAQLLGECQAKIKNERIKLPAALSAR